MVAGGRHRAADGQAAVDRPPLVWMPTAPVPVAVIAFLIQTSAVPVAALHSIAPGRGSRDVQADRVVARHVDRAADAPMPITAGPRTGAAAGEGGFE